MERCSTWNRRVSVEPGTYLRRLACNALRHARRRFWDNRTHPPMPGHQDPRSGRRACFLPNDQPNVHTTPDQGYRDFHLKALHARPSRFHAAVAPPARVGESCRAIERLQANHGPYPQADEESPSDYKRRMGRSIFPAWRRMVYWDCENAREYSSSSAP